MMPAGRRFVKAVSQALRHRCGVTRGQRLLVAVSGGADSVALMRALADLAPRPAWRLSLAVAHVQHHIRQGEAEADAAFVQELALHQGLPFLRVDLDLSSCPGNLESAARRQRYEALRGMAETFGAQHVAVAHHGDDQLETILMRLLRGTSVRGLSGMSWRRRLVPDSDLTLLRPMLGLDRAAAEGMLRAIGQAWRQDTTNADTTRFRARLRKDVVPVLQDLRPDASRKALHLSEHMRQISRFLDQSAEEAAAAVARDANGARLDRNAARDMPPVVLASLLRRLLEESGCGADKLGGRALGPLLRAIQDGAGGQRCFRIGKQSKVVVTRGLVEVKWHDTEERHEGMKARRGDGKAPRHESIEKKKKHGADT